ncbi:hypothetical protein [Streptomyces rapamycinicus]|nr:hypothetical protein [Streptomyces rapamycinicus]
MSRVSAPWWEATTSDTAREKMLNDSPGVVPHWTPSTMGSWSRT